MIMQIVEFLRENLNSDALVVGQRPARFEVIEWMPPMNILKEFLLNDQRDLVFSVRQRRVATARFLQRVPHRHDKFLEVAVWLVDRPTYQRRGYITALRDAAVAEVTRIFGENPLMGTVREILVDDHNVGNILVISSVIIIEHQEYE